MVVEPIQRLSGLPTDFSSDAIQKVVGILRTNGSRLESPTGYGKGLGLFPTYSMLNHSCIYNAITKKKFINGVREKYCKSLLLPFAVIVVVTVVVIVSVVINVVFVSAVFFAFGVVSSVVVVVNAVFDAVAIVLLLLLLLLIKIRCYSNVASSTPV
jgi:hypothetical protein